MSGYHGTRRIQELIVYGPLISGEADSDFSPSNIGKWVPKFGHFLWQNQIFFKIFQ